MKQDFLQKTKQYRVKTVKVARKEEPKDATKLQASQEREGQSCSELNYYIELLMLNNDNVDKFVYLVPKDDKNNPYDLQLKYYSDFLNNKKGKKGHVPEDYYTLSINGLTHYKQQRPREFIPLTIWLKER